MSRVKTISRLPLPATKKVGGDSKLFLGLGGPWELAVTSVVTPGLRGIWKHHLHKFTCFPLFFPLFPQESTGITSTCLHSDLMIANYAGLIRPRGKLLSQKSQLREA